MSLVLSVYCSALHALFIRAVIVHVFDDDMKQTPSLLLKGKYIRPLGYKATNAAGSLKSVGHTVDSTFFTHERHQCKLKKDRASAWQLVSITMEVVRI